MALIPAALNRSIDDKFGIILVDSAAYSPFFALST